MDHIRRQSLQVGGGEKPRTLPEDTRQSLMAISQAHNICVDGKRLSRHSILTCSSTISAAGSTTACPARRQTRANVGPPKASREVRRLAHVKQVTVRSHLVGLQAPCMGSVSPGLTESGEDGAECHRLPVTRAEPMTAQMFQGVLSPSRLGELSVSSHFCLSRGWECCGTKRKEEMGRDGEVGSLIMFLVCILYC